MQVDLGKIWLSDKEVQAVGWGGNDPYWHEFLAPITISGVTVEGPFLRGKAARNYVDRAVLLQMEMRLSARNVVHLSRMCWRPFGAHNNNRFGPEEHQLIDIRGTHIHTFYDNYLSHERRMRTGNLKVAVPVIPDYQSCRDFIDEAGKYFRINNIASVPLPPAQAFLL